MILSFPCISGATAYHFSYFGNGPHPHVITSITCTGNENNLLECNHDLADAVTQCGDGAVAGVVCIDYCVDGQVRLAGTTIANSGRVELCVDGVWTTICDSNWDINDAKVVCRELGYPTYGTIM